MLVNRSSAHSSLEKSHWLFWRVEKVLQHIFESVLFDRLVEALKLSLRRVAFLFLLVLLGLVMSAFSLFWTLILSVNTTVLPFLIFILIFVVFPLLAAIFSLVSVLALDALNLPF